MSASTRTYRQGQELPSYAVAWSDENGDLLDLSSGTFQLELINAAGTAVVTKTTGITGAATSPNVTAAWATDELDIATGEYTVRLRHTDSGADRDFRPDDPPILRIV